jgi:ADP-heptose:LPS heptosyltransferase
MKSILVIQLKRIGDVILTTPALKALRKLYPEALIVLLLD